MNIKILQIGKTEEKFLQTGIEEYENRLRKYINVDVITLPNLKNSKNLKPEQVKQGEAKLILEQMAKVDYVILLDEHGKKFRSVAFADYLQKQFNSGKKTLMFIIGGAFGFSDEIYEKAHFKIALSDMTFSHQMIRLLFIEQLYRAMTILRNEPYHNE